MSILQGKYSKTIDILLTCIIAIICGGIGLLVVSPMGPTPVNVTSNISIVQVSNITPELQLQSFMISTFRSSNEFNLPEPDINLSKMAMSNAHNGTHSFKMSAGTYEEAASIYSRYISYPNQYHDSNMFWRVLHGDQKYGISVYKLNHQFNVSVVFYPNPRNEIILNSNGAYEKVIYQDPLTYLWD